MRLPYLHNADELRALVNETGFMPLFRSCVPGFSVEELTPDEYWFKEGVSGPWDWRMQIAADGDIAYAKLFCGKYGFVSREMYPHLANWRREGYDFDARCDDGLVKDAERKLYALFESGLRLSTELRRAFPLKGFETALAALQMRTYVTCSGFERRINKKGEPYGWEIARYDISENVFGDICSKEYDAEPGESYDVIRARLRRYMDESSIDALMRI